MRTITRDQWIEEATLRFGVDSAQWAFVCPACGHVQSLRDYASAGAPEGAIAFSCVGRWLPGVARDAFDRSGAPGPCNYTLGGLFRLHQTMVTHDGESLEVFEFADPLPEHRAAWEAKHGKDGRA